MVALVVLVRGASFTVRVVDPPAAGTFITKVVPARIPGCGNKGWLLESTV